MIWINSIIHEGKIHYKIRGKRNNRTKGKNIIKLEETNKCK
jgi:hypothetical protein